MRHGRGVCEGFSRVLRGPHTRAELPTALEMEPPPNDLEESTGTSSGFCLGRATTWTGTLREESQKSAQHVGIVRCVCRQRRDRLRSAPTIASQMPVWTADGSLGARSVCTPHTLTHRFPYDAVVEMWKSLRFGPRQMHARAHGGQGRHEHSQRDGARLVGSWRRDGSAQPAR